MTFQLWDPGKVLRRVVADEGAALASESEGEARSTLGSATGLMG